MKRVFSIVSMITVLLTASGQEKKKATNYDVLYMDIGEKDSNYTLQSLYGLNIEQLNQYKKEAIKTRNIGISMTMIGSVMAISGYYLVSRESVEQLPLLIFGQSDFGKVDVYGAFFLIGSVTALAGIPVLIIGSHRKQYTEKAIKKLEIIPGTSQGLALKFSISF